MTVQAEQPGHGFFIGSFQLLRTLFVGISRGEVIVLKAASGGNYDLIVDTIPELFHAYYLFDAFSLNEPGGTPVDVSLHGPGIIIVPPAAHLDGVTVTLFKRRKTGVANATQQEVHLFFANSTNVDVTLSYEVYRIAGLT